MNARLLSVALPLIAAIASTAAAQERPDVHDAILVEEGENTPNISTSQLEQILRDGSATVFDVRTYAEYAISHIPGTINVVGKPGSTREEFTSDAAQIGHIVGDDKSAPIVLYCAGPYCGKAGRVADDLGELGYENVRRYQLGIPVWRALGGVTEIEIEGVRHVVARDRTAVLIDTRSARDFARGTLAGAQSIPADRAAPPKGGQEVRNAKEDGRLPMEDHNTRIIVFGEDGSQARAVAEVLTRHAFHNVSYFSGTFDELRAALD